MTHPETLLSQLAGQNLWQSLVVVAIVSLLLFRFKKASAEDKSWAWTATLFSLALLPMASFLPGEGLSTSLFMGETADQVGKIMTVPTAPSDVMPVASQMVPMAPSGLDPAPMAGEAQNFDLGWVILAWGLGTGLSLLFLITAAFNASRLRKTAYPFVSHGRTAPRGWPEDAELAISDHIGGPMVVGIVHPLVLVPRHFARDMATKTLDPLLFHELAHLKRRDNPLFLLERLVMAVYWWNPLMHFICRRLGEERELACDDRAAIACGDQTTYASSLLEGARHLTGHNKSLLALGALHRESPLGSRIRRLTTSRLLTGPSLIGIGKSLFMVMALVLVLGAVTPRLLVNSGTAFAASPQEVEEQIDDGLGQSLVEAAMRGSLKAVKALIEAGADIDYPLRGDGTALIIAVKRNKVDLFDYLMANGADVNVGVRGDGNPLIMAAAHGRMAMVKALVEAGADVDAYVVGDETPLIKAAENKSLKTVKYLVEHGADVNLEVDAHRWLNGLREDKTWTPLSMAKKRGTQAIVDYLIKAGAK